MKESEETLNLCTPEWEIIDVRAEDAGIYTCKQFLTVGGGQEGEDEPVYLSVVINSLSKPVADIVPDRPVSLKCILYTSDGPGKCLSGVTERIGLFWVGEAGNELKNDPRLQVTQTSDCDITLTVRVQKEDNNRKWTCQLTVNDNKEISIDFTFMVPGSRASTAGPSLSTTSPSFTGTVFYNSILCDMELELLLQDHHCQPPPHLLLEVELLLQDHHSQPPPHLLLPDVCMTWSPDNMIYMVVGVAVGVAVGVIAVVIKVHRRRTKNQMTADGSLNQPADSITYASIGHINHKAPKINHVHGEDTVTYASVMTSTDRRRETENPDDPNSYYSTVNKP
ncbi:hypothetical protein DPEC_G00088970 [Dallia pectoralis]|uniref:Uncharacterized protein n=1 Tax=Dallia pectoralis TaxID=75939 RepID=A0ACC2H081_DALPE|nr:hypothetical protein DPEC_G00088970 [Dallia pectoralis]